ncbi:hypothetical protein BV898_13166 [Hypsibius exemplaris]|uniref:Uncharacterized protein n=1 Tax=Hypsibius exemplaris TaxID=2072580 RepID=A0A1W0WBL9_HYPEX|nr:hypothetical protein BV898_13166 [Hypsibius exemplaris]
MASPSSSFNAVQYFSASPYGLADAKRKRVLLGTGVVQFIFGGFLLLPVFFVLGWTVPVVVVLLAWMTVSGLLGISASYFLPNTPNHHENHSPTHPNAPAVPPRNVTLKAYTVGLIIGLILAVATLLVGAALIQPLSFQIVSDSDYRKYFGDLEPAERVLFGTATMVLGAWLATVLLIMFILALHVLHKHYRCVERAIRAGRPVIDTNIATHYGCPDVLTSAALKRPDQFEEPFFPPRKALMPASGKIPLSTADRAPATGEDTCGGANTNLLPAKENSFD